METCVLVSYHLDHVLPFVSTLGTIFFLYVGPDQLLPLASVLGAVIGVLLIVWNRVTAFLRKILQSFSKKENAAK